MNIPNLTLFLKKKLFLKCMDLIEQKIQHEVNSIEDAQAAANLETKSSAGDEFEFRGKNFQVLSVI